MTEETDWDVVIIGAGPAGLSAALNLARARRRTLVLDSNRPRNSATFHSHGFLSRDGISPLELRKLGREELEAYPYAAYEKSLVTSVEPGFTVIHGNGVARARSILIATGLREVLPALPTLRAYYGTSIHSCMECDAYEYSDRPLALIGETDDLAERALLLAQWSRDLIVFTNGAAVVTEADEARLTALGVRVERRTIEDVVGDRNGLTGVVLSDGETVPRVAAFVRPRYEPTLDFLAPLAVERDADQLIAVDPSGRASVAGVYAVGDVTPPGPQQLIVAAGHGGHVAAVINRDLIG
ncbi:MAG: NAD(P)/FAD-dependent oxidoreductase [Salinibacterium sp.]|nr:MAG: NAD(P)/FAD-dependent oxidoreductase [Salinibacterium sp.]